MGRLFVEFVEEEDGAKYVCTRCSCDIASEKGLLWEGYMGSCTPALLFRTAVNVEPCAAKREEVLSTGQYTLVDVRCRTCQFILGWRYLSAESVEQKYKVGSVLLQKAELARITNLQALSLPPPRVHA